MAPTSSIRLRSVVGLLCISVLLAPAFGQDPFPNENGGLLGGPSPAPGASSGPPAQAPIGVPPGPLPPTAPEGSVGAPTPVAADPLAETAGPPTGSPAGPPVPGPVATPGPIAPFTAADSVPPSSPLAAEPPPDGFPEITTPPPPGTPSTITWCTTSADEEKFCNTAVTELEAKSSFGTNWKCVSKPDPFACMEAIRAWQADLMVLEAGLAFVAFQNFSMKAIMGEKYTEGATAPESYKAVALVRASLCQDKKFKLASLKGKTSCHTGYSTAAGWDLPLRELVKLDLQKPIDKTPFPADIEMMTSFFGKSCSVGNTVNNSICTGCPGEAGCSESYTGNIGALRCLANGGDVAFLRNELLPPFQCNGARNKDCSIPGLEQLHLSDYKLVCPLGGCADAATYQDSCVIGDIPGNAVMVRNQAKETVVQEIVMVLQELRDGNSMLFSPAKNNDLLFSALAVGVVPLPPGLLTRTYLGDAGWAAQNVSSWAMGNSYSGAAVVRVSATWLLSGALSVLIALLFLR